MIGTKPGSQAGDWRAETELMAGSLSSPITGSLSSSELLWGSPEASPFLGVCMHYRPKASLQLGRHHSHQCASPTDLRLLVWADTCGAASLL